MRDLSQLPIESFDIADLRPTDKVAPSFRAYELTISELAQRQGIDNAFVTNAQLHAAVFLARNVLQPVRDAYGAFSPNSVFRSQALERFLKRKPAGWTSASQHTKGQACDIEIPGFATLYLAQWCADYLQDFDQIICECYDPRLGPNAGWVHVSVRDDNKNRRQKLSYVRFPSGKFDYIEGLRASSIS